MVDKHYTNEKLYVRVYVYLYIGTQVSSKCADNKKLNKIKANLINYTIDIIESTNVKKLMVEVCDYICMYIESIFHCSIYMGK